MTSSTDTTAPSPIEGRTDRRFAQRRGRGPALKLRHFAVGGVLLALLAVVVAFSFHKTYVAPMEEPMVRVNDKVFSLGDYVARLRHLDAEGKLVGQPANFSTDPFRLLEDLVGEELIRQGSPRMGVTVSEAEVTQALKERLGAVLKQQDKLTDEEVERQFQELLTQRLTDVNLTEAQYRTLVRNSLLRQKLADRLEARVPAVAEQIHVEGFKVQDAQAARTLADRWRKGADVVQLVREDPVSQESKDQRGDLGWLPKRAFDPGIDEAIWRLPPGDIPEPFLSSPGYMVVRVAGPPEIRAVEGVARDKLKQRAVDDWLEEERKPENNKVERYFDSKRYDYVIDKVREYLR